MRDLSSSISKATASNIGVVVVFVLIAVLIFVSLNEPFLQTRQLTPGDQGGPISSWRENRLARLLARFEGLSIILFIIFLAIVFTKAALILSGVPSPP